MYLISYLYYFCLCERVRMLKHEFRGVKEAPKLPQTHVTTHLFTYLSLTVLPSIRKTCSYEGLLEQLLTETGDILLSLQLLCC